MPILAMFNNFSFGAFRSMHESREKSKAQKIKEQEAERGDFHEQWGHCLSPRSPLPTAAKDKSQPRHFSEIYNKPQSAERYLFL
jgi:hypothetical protein